MWLRRINDGGEEFRYELQDYDAVEFVLEDGTHTQGFLVIKYWRNNNGEFQRCSEKSYMYISTKALLSQFVLIDSKIDDELKSLQDFKNSVYAERLDKSLKPFCFDNGKDNDVIIPQAAQ